MSNYLNYKTLDKEEKAKVLNELYNSQKLSTIQMSKLTGTSTTQLMRDMKKAGIATRNRSDAQKVALENGASIHPTEGKKRDINVRRKIGLKRSESFAALSDEEKELISQKHRERFMSQSDAKRKEIQYSGQLAIREASKHGSKIEIYLKERLMLDGYVVEHHREHLIKNEKLHLDLMLPKINIAIEVDGPSHYEPVWGVDALANVRKADAEKNALLVSQGLHCIRVKTRRGTISEVYKTGLYDLLKETIEQLTKEKTPKVLYI